MAPMGNGDLGHHPEKMLPPPEAPDIQVDIVMADIVIAPDIQVVFVMLAQILLFSILCWLFYSQTFLTSNKERVDDDPDANPYDDLRHYAYEVWNLTKYRLTLIKLILQGDGNSGGSLSSLNSGTDDADLEFEYLHNFGPRYATIILIIQLTECNIENFRSFSLDIWDLGTPIFPLSNLTSNRFKKLADMYGRESDSDESEVSLIRKCSKALDRQKQHFNDFPSPGGSRLW